jgi:hypothetical protein
LGRGKLPSRSVCCTTPINPTGAMTITKCRPELTYELDYIERLLMDY